VTGWDYLLFLRKNVFTPCNKPYIEQGPDDRQFASFSLFMFMDLDCASGNKEANKEANKELGHYQAILT